MTDTPQAPAAPNRQHTALGCGVLVAGLLGGCWYLLTPDSSPEGERARAFSTARAVTVTLCEAETTRRLRAPASADFPFGHVTTVQALEGEGRYRLTSYVDAQNAFGAQIRTRFSCVVEGQGPELSGYSITSFTMLD